jgi:DNA-binding GntR family transcriptional regulator
VLADQVYEELVVALVDGKLAPGTALSIDGLARELQVSATPVREALARLESTGLVSRVALKGYRVSPPLSTEEMLQLLAARLVIEPVNAREACQKVTPDFVQSLEDSLQRQAKAPTDVSFAVYREFWVADEEFHRLIAEHAGNRFLLSAYDALGGQIQRFRHFGTQGVRDASAALSEHAQIVEAFRKGDPQGAESAMEGHIVAVRDRVLRRG